ncbi:E3 ubiquitin-protein ligase RING1-like [Cynara cardunculus var. scolymus]|uniref:E3 ubiquitin-protein ligase RING1-like n=1 Tax=Cynara cardunculus var. scolymus TaxID=59895 RepID=UPI000D6248AF|nr:E3 ubiquitin-protein ligase RING1-like [Cynara cardunculus var. scolymus]
MSSSPAPEFDQFLRDFITSFARTRTVSAASTPPPDHDGGGGGESLVFRVFSIGPGNPVNNGPLPASKSAIEAMPVVTATEEEDCAICLTEYGDAGEAKEMPCKHRYHSDCIQKWLNIHGSCPVCRYEMPVDEEEKRRRDGGMRWRVMITVTRQTPAGESNRNSLDSIENNGSLTEDMDIDVGRIGDWNSDSMDLD